MKTRDGREMGENHKTTTSTRTLSLWQPWATLCAIRAKCWETRGWKLPLGVMAIHAAQLKKHPDQLRAMEQPEIREALAKAGYNTLAELPFGAVLCVAKVGLVLPTRQAVDQGFVDAREMTMGDYSEFDRTSGKPRFCARLDEVRALKKPFPATGRQGYYYVELGGN